ncbi:RTA1 domain-containing protein [Aspergillus brunneoviolaceus CBS 621.78]|uniref:Uncharacterized protein n=1 Tax=Aspergillus brunneoviolaceus CBS 621.78 TaxID=1450534 RepID=A0ACD1GHR0_9EURO|nr:hypothetical protein BO95DRAFT_356359 [Aspergillus brunneoviolaceus CBS 621.78]RAH48700.1 hypothetical protein BO95DRAFT_356359 [Aspergillus brunneoviolaceus CBS 621.78]
MSTTTSMATATSALTSATTTETCTHPQPGKNGYLPPEACDAVLMYVPSFAAAVLFGVLFGFTTICHLVQAVIYKKRYAWVVIMGALWELLAFIFRALLTRKQNSDIYDTLYTIFFLLAPICEQALPSLYHSLSAIPLPTIAPPSTHNAKGINAYLYMTLGRLIHFFLPTRRLAHLTSTHYARLFVWLDIVAFLVQLAGASMTTGEDQPQSTIMRGLHIYMGGIGMQEFFVLIFTGLTIHLHRKLLAMERAGTLDAERVHRAAGGPFRPTWKKLLAAMYLALGLITVRIVFRLAQYARGSDVNNPVLTHEWYEYVFDAVPMFVALVGLNVVHPGQVLRGEGSEFPRLSRREKKALKRERKERKREERMRRKLGNGAGESFEELGALEGGDVGVRG